MASARAERARGADAVQAAEEAPHPQPVVVRVEVRPAPAAARVERERVAAVLDQRLPVDHERRDHRDLGGGELEREAVLLEDLRARPAARPVELGDDGLAVLDPDLVDAVLVAVEREHPPVGAHAGRLDRRDDGLGREPGVRCFVGFARKPLFHLMIMHGFSVTRVAKLSHPSHVTVAGGCYAPRP